MIAGPYPFVITFQVQLSLGDNCMGLGFETWLLSAFHPHRFGNRNFLNEALNCNVLQPYVPGNVTLNA